MNTNTQSFRLVINNLEGESLLHFLGTEPGLFYLGNTKEPSFVCTEEGFMTKLITEEIASNVINYYWEDIDVHGLADMRWYFNGICKIKTFRNLHDKELWTLHITRTDCKNHECLEIPYINKNIVEVLKNKIQLDNTGKAWISTDFLVDEHDIVIVD